MLTLKGITKEYSAGDMKVEALRGVDLEFGKSEFTAILGPSGCGKTTLLNIIGGLDRYDEGDLLINGRSTKEFREKDWNTYRNHSIGFVFQTYNLIPHQTVLANVELALTLAGVSREERKRRATEALAKVGLSDQLKKKPNQMSGGQMQRVAIARALVNNPDILLADEPTGALDSETSIQVMEILREIAREKLVIMVTHNPELAEAYATRTIRLLDGKVISDTGNEAAPEQARPRRAKETAEQESAEVQRKPSMSFLTALGLSLNNLLTKKGRTILTAFAGSIGIIGIALILSLSNGVNNYIDKVQRDVLASYPITIDSETMDMTESLRSLMSASQEEKEQEQQEGEVKSDSRMTNTLNSWMSGIKTNDLHAFKKWLDSHADSWQKLVTDIQYEYATPLIVYRMDLEEPLQVNPSKTLESTGLLDMLGGSGNKVGIQQTMIDNAMRSTNAFGVLPDNVEMARSQYEVLAGRMPEADDEIVVILNSKSELGDMTQYTLGLKDQKLLSEQFTQLWMGGGSIATTGAAYTYDMLMNMRFRLFYNTSYYVKDEGSAIWKDKRNDKAYMTAALADETKSMELKVVGIVKTIENTMAASMYTGGGIGYRRGLIQYLLNTVVESTVVKDQISKRPDPSAETEAGRKGTDIFSGAPFSPEAKDVRDLITELRNTDDGRTDKEKISDFIAMMEEQGILPRKMLPEWIYGALDFNLIESAIERGSVMIKGTSYEDNMKTLGVYIDEASDGDRPEDYPSVINIYARNFEAKKEISRLIKEYNASVGKAQQITYTDYVGLLMDSVTTIVAYTKDVLIAFVAISLVVSSIMIGIITYISVLERTKEIGILRAIGASRRDISRVFNAETLIIGFGAGAIGIGVTLLLVLIMNLYLNHLTGIANLASLPTGAAFALVGISMLLTLIAGIIPSRIAAQKDPVVALRTE